MNAPRITTRKLRHLLDEINTAAHTTGQTAYELFTWEGTPRLYQVQQTCPDCRKRPVSPLMTRRTLFVWLTAYLDGLRRGYTVACEDAFVLGVTENKQHIAANLTLWVDMHQEALCTGTLSPSDFLDRLRREINNLTSQ